MEEQRNNANTAGDRKSKLPRTNKLTNKANLFFNVNGVKNWLKRFYKNSNLFVSRTNKAEEKDSDTATTNSDNVEDKDKSKNIIPKFNNSHVALSAVSEVLCNIIISETKQHLESEKSGLYLITSKVLKNVILLNSDLRYLFSKYLDKYNSNMMYLEQFFISHKDLNAYIDNIFDSNITLDTPAYNLLGYCLLNIVLDISKNSYNLMMYAHKKSIDFNAIRCCVLNMCPDNIVQLVNIKLDCTFQLCKNVEKDDDEDDEEDKPEDKQADEELDVVPDRINPEFEQAKPEQSVAVASDEVKTEEVEPEPVKPEPVKPEQVEPEKVKPAGKGRKPKGKKAE